MQTDFLIIGAGIAGASAAFALAAQGRVVLLEREDQPGYHSTGRSAALYTELYGNAPIRALTRLSRPFLESPPDGFTDHPILTPRGALFVATAAQQAQLDSIRGFAREAAVPVREMGPTEALELVPVLRPDSLYQALYEAGSQDIEVHALHNGYLKELRRQGGTLVTGAEVQSLERKDGLWHAMTPAGAFTAPVVVNAAGAWADAVAGIAGVRPIGLTPKRRTALLFDPPEGIDPAPWPMVLDAEEQWYFKPDAGKLLASPADETPVAPCDAQPEELDIAVAVDRIERVTTMQIRRIDHRWAGLRTFASDRAPVVGFAPDVDGFFWLAGQGGYGVMTAPAMAEATAAQVTGGAMPERFVSEGASKEALSPNRFS